MQRFEGAPLPQGRPHAFGVWYICVALLLGPSFLVWSVRLTALGLGCVPGPQLCRNIAVGGGFRDTLDRAWLVGTNPLVGLAIAFAAAI